MVVTSDPVAGVVPLNTPLVLMLTPLGKDDPDFRVIDTDCPSASVAVICVNPEALAPSDNVPTVPAATPNAGDEPASNALNSVPFAIKMTIDFGEEIGIKKSSAQITDHYNPQSLVGMQVAAVVNFPKKQIGPFMSDCLVTGFTQSDGSIILAVPQKGALNGSRLA